MKKLFKKYKWLRKYWLEILLLLSALFITLVSLIIFNINNQSADEEIVVEQSGSPTASLTYIYIDVSGEVTKPDVYRVRSGTRLKEVINLAGNLSKNADDGFFYRNYNLSRILVDQEKIYVPSVWEVNNGYFLENRQTLDFIYPAVTALNNELKVNLLVNLNSATPEELDTLPGVGKATAEKIINNRPYQTIEELVTKKIVNKSVFEKIKNQIDI